MTIPPFLHQRKRRTMFRDMRKSAGLTQGDVAIKLEYSNYNAIHLKETGRRPVYARDLLALAKIVEDAKSL